MAITAAELVAKISVSGASTAKSEIEGMGGAVEGAGSKLGLLAGGVALAAGVALVGLGAKSVKMAADFQSSMTGLVTGAGESAANIKLVSQGILDMAVQTGTSTKQLSDGMFMIESAGFHGAAGLQVLSAAAMGAKVGNADLGTVADATTTILKDFGNTGITASGAVNTLIATVANGKTHMQDLSASLSQILPTASAARVSLTDVMGAMATMTGEGVPAANAATYLRQTIIGLEAPSSGAAKALASVGLSSSQVATEMQKSLPDALKMITDAVGKKFPEGSAAYVDAIKKISGGSKTMQGMLDLTGQHLKDFQANVASVGDTVKKGGNSIVGWSNVQQDFNFKLQRAKEVVETFGIKIGTALLPVLGKVLDFLTGPALTGLEKLGNIIGGVIGPAVTQAKDAFEALFQPVQKLHVAAAPLLDTFDRATAVFSKFQGVSAPLTDTFDRATAVFGKFNVSAQRTGEAISPLNQVMDVLKGLGRAALNMSPLVNTIEGVARHGKELGEWWQQSVIPALKQAEPGFKNLGQALAGLLPAFEQIAQSVHNNFQKAFDALLPAFKAALPVIIQIAGALANGLGNAIKFLTPYIVNAADAIGKFGVEIAQRVGPFVKGFFDELNKDMPAIKAVWNAVWPSLSATLKGTWDTIVGLVQISWALVTGIIKVGLDVMSGNWKQAWEDVKSTLSGIWDGIKTIFGSAIDMVISDFNRFKDQVVQAAQSLSDILVGHSIIPDMINGIVSWFEQLPGRAMAAMQALVSQVTGALSGLASSALSAGAAIVNNVAAGITSGIGTVTNAIAGVTQAIADHLPHSPAKRGALSKLNDFGLALVRTFANDITSHSPKAHAAAEHMVEGVAAKLKAYPVEIAKARLAGNTALVKSLEAARHQDELLMRDFKDELTIHGDRFSALYGIVYGGTAAHHAATKGKHATAGSAVGSLANNGARAFVGRGGERLNFSGSGASGSVSGGSGSGGSTSRTASGQPVEIILNIDGKRVAKAIIPDIVMLIRNGTGTLL